MNLRADAAPAEGPTHSEDTSESSTDRNSTPRTYADLIAYVARRADLALDEQQERNRASALKKFLEFHGLTSESPVGPELGGGLASALKEFVESKKEGGRKPGSVANSRSSIRRWARHWAELIESESAPRFAELHEAFRYYFDLRQAKGKVSLYSLAKTVGFATPSYLNNLVLKQLKSFEIDRIELFATLEELLEAPATSLTRFARVRLESMEKKRAEKRNKTAYSQKVSELVARPYRLVQLPAPLLKEVRDFIKFKTAIRPPGGLIRNERWVVRKLGEVSTKKRTTAEQASLDGKTIAPTATFFLQQVQAFFGVMAQQGHDPETFSLAWMLDPDLLDAVIEFYAERMGAVTTSSTSLIKSIRSLIYSKGGWLFQQPAFSSRLHKHVSMSKDEWESFCNQRRVELEAVKARFEKDRIVKPGRDPKEPIQSILEREHPISALYELVGGIEERIKVLESNPHSVRGPTLMVLQRDRLIFRIMIPQPLRVRMMKVMTWRADNSGNLYLRRDGRWAIRFKPEDFKNEKGAAKDKPYDVPLPATLSDEIEYYLKTIRPQFTPKTDYVFVPAPTGSAISRELPLDNQGGGWLNDMIRARSAAFLSECPGFGPHAIRHIVATDYIRNNPNSYVVAADILHDKIATVMRAYAHLRAADGHRVYQEYLSDIEKLWRGA
jgi:integrase